MPKVLTVTVVVAEVEEAITRLPLDALQDEKENGPEGAVVRVAATPLSNHPSPVGDVNVKE